VTAATQSGLRQGRDLLPMAASLLSGLLTALPLAMLAAVGRERGGEEATFLHLVTLVAGLAAVSAVFALRGTRPAFLRPLNSGWSMVALAAAFGVVAAICVSGIEWYYLSTGIISVAIFLLVTWSLVRLSLGLYFASSTLGSVSGSLVMDQIGAFGAIERDISPIRVAGALLVAAGVVVVRTAK
jgi:hypothetical protein